MNKEINPTLARIIRLGQEAIAATTEEQWVHIVAHKTIHCLPYDRMWIWQWGPHRCIGTSLATPIDPASDLCQKVADEAAAYRHQTRITMVEKEGHYRLWLPLYRHDATVVGLWLERQSAWSEEEQKLWQELAPFYGMAWKGWFRKRKKIGRLGAVGALLLLLCLGAGSFLHVPMRVIAPCEVVPHSPTVLTAPVDGVIEQIHVEPGQHVEQGTLLFSYDKRWMEAQVRQAEKQRQMVLSERKRMLAQLVQEKHDQFAQLSLLDLQKEQHDARIEFLQKMAEKLDVYAPHSGMVWVSDPDDWRGKPVSVGEKVLRLSRHGATAIKVSIEERDKLDFQKGDAVQIVLHAHPHRTYGAVLRYLSPQAQPNQAGVNSFEAMADWQKMGEKTTLGLRGHAILYGPSVPFFYMLWRKPIGLVRATLGF